jgi:hypothetical protein
MVQTDTHNPSENIPTPSTRKGGDRANQWKCDARTKNTRIGGKTLTTTQLM